MQKQQKTHSRVLRQILMYLNHLWVCLVFYKVLAIFNLLYSIIFRPITWSCHIILFTGIDTDKSHNLFFIEKSNCKRTKVSLTLSYRPRYRLISSFWIVEILFTFLIHINNFTIPEYPMLHCYITTLENVYKKFHIIRNGVIQR